MVTLVRNLLGIAPVCCGIAASSLPKGVSACPKPLIATLRKVEEHVPELFQCVERSVGSVQIKLLLPVVPYNIGSFFPQEYVKAQDLQNLGLDIDQFALTQFKNENFIARSELKKHNFDIGGKENYTARWNPESRTIFLSYNIFKQAIVYLVFELTNASLQDQFSAVRLMPKEKQVRAVEKVEFTTTRISCETLNAISPSENIYRLSHKDFELHLMHQELVGHSDIIAAYLGAPKYPSLWPHPMTREEKKNLRQLLDYHANVLFGNISEKLIASKVLSEQIQNLKGNLLKNWEYYHDKCAKVYKS